MERLTGHVGPRDRLLLIRLGAVGDVLRTLPALHLIRRTFPSIHLTWIVEELSRELLLDHPEIDQVITFPRRELRRTGLHPTHLPAILRRLARDLRREQFSVAVDLQGSFKSALVAILSAAPRRIGFAPGHCREMSFLLTNEWVRLPSPWLNRVERNLRLVEALGARGDEINLVLPEKPEEGREADAILADLAPGGEAVVLLSPGTSYRQRHKKWPPGHYARLAWLLKRSLGVVPVIAWGPGEQDLAGAIVDAARGSALLAPRVGLRLLAALLRRSALFIGADTGPMHIAWGVGCPVVALFGPTDPRLNAPLGRSHVVLREGPAMALIAPEVVLEVAERITRRTDPRPPPARGLSLPRYALNHHPVGAAPRC
jgi:lipopolysaccharide heptosyltransferase I